MSGRTWLDYKARRSHRATPRARLCWVPPETRYAKSGDVHIAYQVLGEGALDLVWIPSLAHHVELNWENPLVAQGSTGWLEWGA